jgi:hypothetical protein
VQASCSFFSPLLRTSCTTGPSVEGRHWRFSLPSWQYLQRHSSQSKFAQLAWHSTCSNSQCAARFCHSPEPRHAPPISPAPFLRLKIVSSLRTSEGPITVDSFIILTLHNLSSAVTDSLFVRLSCQMLETGALRITLDLPLFHGVEPECPRRSGANMLAINHNRYVFRSFPAFISPSKPGIGYVTAYQYDRTKSGPYLDPRIAFGMSVLTNLALMSLTGTALCLSSVLRNQSFSAWRIWCIRRDESTLLESASVRRYNTILAIM